MTTLLDLEKPIHEIDPDNVADGKAVDEKRKRTKREDRERQDALRALMGTKQGRSWLWWLLEKCHVNHTSFDVNPSLMAFREGERNIGLIVTAEAIAASPGLYLKMREEQNV